MIIGGLAWCSFRTGHHTQVINEMMSERGKTI
jgi:hypothetical protein